VAKDKAKYNMEVGMARKPRYTLPGIPQHVIQRGHNREPCFYTKHDYLRYLEDLNDAAISNQAAIHAYVLMTNHVHLLVTPGLEHRKKVTEGFNFDQSGMIRKKVKKR
jgi:REP element-mobilizing transposase RayT